MEPDSQFPGPLAPFSIPIPVPTTDPFEPPFIEAKWNVEWNKYVLGALLSLVAQYTWDTDDSAVLWLAQRRAMTLISSIQSGYPGQRPFWETDDDLDDETLPDTPWYDKISDWVIEAFLAITFTPQAAIIYSSTIPKMRLLFRTGDIGGTVRVLIDGVEVLYESLFSETPALIERVVEAVPVNAFARGLMGTEPPYELRIEKADNDDTTNIQVVLGDIRPVESNYMFRQVEHCPLEFSDDGGQTWTEIYSAEDCVTDGINAAVTNDTVATPDDIEDLGRAQPPDTIAPDWSHLCAGIKAVVDKVEDYLDAVLAGVDLSKETLAIASDISALSVAGDVVVNDIIALVADSIALTTAAIRAAKGANGLDELKELLFCLAKDDGGFYRNTFEAWRNANVDGNIWKEAMQDASKMVSWLEWASVYAVAATNEDNSCEAGYSCAWCYTFDFTVDPGPFHAYYGNEQWVSGVGWQTYTNGNGDQIGGPQLDIQDEFIIERIVVHYSNASSDVFDNQLVGRTGVEPYTYQLFPDQSVGNHTYNWVLGTPTASTQIHVALDCSGQSEHNTVTRITIYGVGENPFGQNNC